MRIWYKFIQHITEGKQDYGWTRSSYALIVKL